MGSILHSSRSNISVNCGIQSPSRLAAGNLGTMPVPCLAGLRRRVLGNLHAAALIVHAYASLKGELL